MCDEYRQTTISDLIAQLEAIREARGDGVIRVYKGTYDGRNHYRDPVVDGHWEHQVWQVTL